MAAQALATYQDLEDMWRPLADSEIDRATGLLARASAHLRNAAPSIDDRIAAFEADPTDPRGLDPTLVATICATIVKRFISNVEGVATQSVGGYSVSYALRTEKTIRGELLVTPEDLQQLFPNRKRPRAGTIRVRPALAPRPIGRYGPLPSVREFAEAVVDWRGSDITPDVIPQDFILPPDLEAGQ